MNEETSISSGETIYTEEEYLRMYYLNFQGGMKTKNVVSENLRLLLEDSMDEEFDFMGAVLTNHEFIILSQMPYNQFLQTNYWRIVRKEKRRTSKAECERCGNRYELQVHHRTYKHRGYEYEHPEDLIMLCGQCHRKQHGIKHR